MKVGILTYHRANNYGAYLQAYALTMKVRSLGYEAEIIDYDMKCAEERYKVHNRNPIRWYNENIRRNMFKYELRNLPVSKESLVSDSISDFEKFIANRYDAIIAGSDEVWKIDSFRGFPNPYWLIDNNNYQRFSYAASSRSDFSVLGEEQVEVVKGTLRKFSLIGVRDSFTYSELNRIIGESEKIELCCDPVFLFDFEPSKERGKEILKNRFNVRIDRPILGIMLNDEKLARRIRSELGKEYELVSLYRQWPWYKKTASLTPFEWIDVIAALDVLVSNYFHGVCFSMISNTYFVAIDSREKNVEHGKIYDLLNRNSMLNTFLSTTDTEYMDKTVKLCKSPKKLDYSKAVTKERSLGEHYFAKFVEALR